MARRRPARTIGNMPFAITSFVGRERDIREVRRLLVAARLVTLTGVGGVGKTRLATEVAAAAGQSFPDGVWLVDLAPVGDADLVAQAVMTSLRINDISNRSAEQQVVDHLVGLHALLVMDNCEHLVQRCGALCEHLLRSCAELRILATSRESLGIVGEHVYPVPPLSMPTSGTAITLTALAAFEAPTLLLERARAVRPEITVTDGDTEVVTRVCHRLDGIPLAIELAASRLRSLTMTGLLERLDDRFTLLNLDARATAPRQQTLRALIDWSYGLSRPAEQLLWARLSVFAGGFTLDAAEGVCSGPDLPREQILDLIDHLITQSILVLILGDGPPRYRMLETIREYGWHRLTELGETGTLRKRHCDYYLALADRSVEAWDTSGQAASLAELRAEHDNFQTALDWATSEPTAAHEALVLVATLRNHWCADKFLADGRRWTERALRRTATDNPDRIPALWVLGWIMLLQGDHDHAEQVLEECITCATAADDYDSIARARSLRGTAAIFRGRLAESIAIFESVLTDFPDDDDLARLILFQLAMSQAHAGDDRASETARRGVALADKVGEQWTKSLALWALGFDQYLHGRHDEAITSICAALEIHAVWFDDHVATALMFELVAWIAAARGEDRRAARLLGAVGSEWRRIGTSITAFGPDLGKAHDTCERITAAALPEAVLRSERARGERLDHEQMIAYVLDHHKKAAEPAKRDDTVLTAREQQVAELVAEGLSNRQIAKLLVVSPRTVDRHLENILGKLGFSSRAQIAAWTIRSQQAP